MPMHLLIKDQVVYPGIPPFTSWQSNGQGALIQTVKVMKDLVKILTPVSGISTVGIFVITPCKQTVYQTNLFVYNIIPPIQWELLAFTWKA